MFCVPLMAFLWSFVISLTTGRQVRQTRGPKFDPPSRITFHVLFKGPFEYLVCVSADERHPEFSTMSNLGHDCNPCCTAGLSSLRPTGRMWPKRQYCAAREVMYILIISWTNEIMKPDSNVLQSSVQLIQLSSLYDGSYSQNSLKIWNIPQLCFMRPHLKTWLTGVRHTVDLSWKSCCTVSVLTGQYPVKD